MILQNQIISRAALIGALSTSIQSFAQTENTSDRDQAELPGQNDGNEETNTSQKNRANKSFEAKLGIKPIGTSFKKSSNDKIFQMNEYLLTANFGYFLDAHTTLAAYVGQSNNTDVLLQDRVTVPSIRAERSVELKWNGTSNAYGFEATRYIGNSFKMVASINSSSISLEPSANEYGIATNPFKMNFSTFGLSLGNQWHWSNFTLNWDWLSAEYVLSGKVEDKKLDPGTTTRGFLLVSNFSVGWVW